YARPQRQALAVAEHPGRHETGVAVPCETGRLSSRASRGRAVATPVAVFRAQSSREALPSQCIARANFYTGTASRWTSLPSHRSVHAKPATSRFLTKSGRPGSNRRRPAWEAGILPLNYAREDRVTVAHSMRAGNTDCAARSRQTLP